MTEATTPLLPSLVLQLQELGENLRLARLRRGSAAALIAERAGMSRPTLRAVERGDPGVAIGAYARVLQTLGLEKELAELARDDRLGRMLQDLDITVKKRAPRRVTPP